eukprot:TRINITY_DN537_c0_g1_i5.p1 TRINITY_DN537_c0_g1~~TRINITY_DN537_c0_g1_i5.p1  ORF type:complete len:121 (-),score=24.62 TRINITY_DN537_c0_g1_i5:223-585(-)
MHLLVIFLAAAVSAQNSPPPPPPDRIWFRQDSLPAGETCASIYETVKNTPAVIKGKDPIILADDATFRICIKFLTGTYTNLKLGRLLSVKDETGPMTVERRAPVPRAAVSSSLVPLPRIM